jgi:hypothetical protein
MDVMVVKRSRDMVLHSKRQQDLASAYIIEGDNFPCRHEGSLSRGEFPAPHMLVDPLCTVPVRMKIFLYGLMENVPGDDHLQGTRAEHVLS